MQVLFEIKVSMRGKSAYMSFRIVALCKGFGVFNVPQPTAILWLNRASIGHFPSTGLHSSSYPCLPSMIDDLTQE